MSSCIFPSEILNQIYLERATILLKEHLASIHIEYDAFLSYLDTFDMVMMGSFALACFDISFKPKDLDLFGSMCDGRQVLFDFPLIMSKDKPKLEVEKLPIFNSSCREDPTNYKYKIRIDESFTVDLNDIKEGLSSRDDCCSVMFTKDGWVLPFSMRKNIEDYLIKKESGNLCSLSFFSDMYDPWGYGFFDEMMRCCESYSLPQNTLPPEFSKLEMHYNHNITHRPNIDSCYDYSLERWVQPIHSSRLMVSTGNDMYHTRELYDNDDSSRSSDTTLNEVGDSGNEAFFRAFEEEIHSNEPAITHFEKASLDENEDFFRAFEEEIYSNGPTTNHFEKEPSSKNTAKYKNTYGIFADFGDGDGKRPFPDYIIEVYLDTQKKNIKEIPGLLNGEEVINMFKAYKKTYRLLKYMQRGWKFPEDAFII